MEIKHPPALSLTHTQTHAQLTRKSHTITISAIPYTRTLQSGPMNPYRDQNGQKRKKNQVYVEKGEKRDMYILLVTEQ